MTQGWLSLPALLAVSGIASAEGWVGTFQSGLTYTDNLEVAADSSTATDTPGSLTRGGVKTGISLNRQVLDGTGGYVLESSASLNKGWAGRKDIRQARLAAYRLAALNQDWLLRAGVQGDAYTNGDVPTESYQGVGAEATLGYMGKTNSGTDIALTFKQERHPAYRMGRSAMKLAHYFPHRKGQAYWSLRGTYQQDAATDDSLDGAGNALGIGYEQWSLGAFKGTAEVEWQQKQYDQRQTRGTPPPGMFPPGGVPPAGMTLAQREDTTARATISLSKPLKKNLNVHLSSSIGQYASTSGVNPMDTAGTKERFNSFSAGLRWDF
ncbi:hypothetical protein [Thiothrix sp.]|jgi:hypothetical protein|uniref:hypothetical protein n=1 Tax=Thiothrix sp. TaxID=1032 RepID=UPI00257FBF42|nr:hypothetical protein [Thiothrix sp.]